MAVEQLKGATGRINLGTAIPLDTPMRLTIDSSSICNFRCAFCPHSSNDKEMLAQAAFPFELAKKIIDDATQFPQKIKQFSLAVFGEPFVNKKLPEILQYAQSKDIAEKYEMTTNGSLLTPDIANKLTADGDRNFLINISIYGLCNEDYYHFCGIKTSNIFNKIIENVRYLFSIKKSAHIHIKITDAVCKTEEQRNKFFEIFSPICDSLSVEHAVSMWYESPNNETDADMNIYMQPRMEKHICALPFYMLTVNTDGTVVPCCNDWKCRFNLGNAKEQSLLEIWNGKAFRECQLKHLQSGYKNFSPCSSCGFPELVSLDNIDAYKDEVLKRL